MVLLVSPAVRLAASEVNAMYRPSALIDVLSLERSAWVPSVATLTRLVVRACRSRRKTSPAVLVSPGTRLWLCQR